MPGSVAWGIVATLVAVAVFGTGRSPPAAAARRVAPVDVDRDDEDGLRRRSPNRRRTPKKAPSSSPSAAPPGSARSWSTPKATPSTPSAKTAAGVALQGGCARPGRRSSTKRRTGAEQRHRRRPPRHHRPPQRLPPGHLRRPPALPLRRRQGRGPGEGNGASAFGGTWTAFKGSGARRAESSGGRARDAAISAAAWQAVAAAEMAGSVGRGRGFGPRRSEFVQRSRDVTVACVVLHELRDSSSPLPTSVHLCTPWCVRVHGHRAISQLSTPMVWTTERTPRDPHTTRTSSPNPHSRASRRRLQPCGSPRDARDAPLQSRARRSAAEA